MCLFLAHPAFNRQAAYVRISGMNGEELSRSGWNSTLRRLLMCSCSAHGKDLTFASFGFSVYKISHDICSNRGKVLNKTSALAEFYELL